MNLLLGDKVHVRIEKDNQFTIISGEVVMVGVWKPDVYKFELANLSHTFYTDEEGLTIERVA